MKNFTRLSFAAFVCMCFPSCSYETIPWKSYQDFVTKATKACPIRLPAMGYEIKNDKVCICINKKLKENWSNLDEIEKVLYEKDRAPRGYGDFIPGMLRVTYEMCNPQ